MSGRAVPDSSSPVLVWVLFGLLNGQCAVNPTMAWSKPGQNRAAAGGTLQQVATKKNPFAYFDGLPGPGRRLYPADSEYVNHCSVIASFAFHHCQRCTMLTLPSLS